MVFSPALAHPAGLHGAPAWISNTRFILKDEDSKCTCVLRRPRSGSGLGRGATARPAARAQDTVLTLCQRLPGSYMGISQICTPGLLTHRWLSAFMERNQAMSYPHSQNQPRGVRALDCLRTGSQGATILFLALPLTTTFGGLWETSPFSDLLFPAAASAGWGALAHSSLIVTLFVRLF